MQPRRPEQARVLQVALAPAPVAGGELDEVRRRVLVAAREVVGHAHGPAAAADEGGYAQGVKVRVLQRTDTTALGQPVAYPVTDSAEVTAVEVEIPPGGETGWHRHPFPGYAYVLSG